VVAVVEQALLAAMLLEALLLLEMAVMGQPQVFLVHQ
jgi:hypothetical protein